MSKRKRTSKIEKWIKEGRGSGIGSELSSPNKLAPDQKNSVQDK
ncbi:hypothetical protein MHI39_01050 [Heyndrickxia sp. FSL K6-6286]|jgi:hypothetical protein